MNRPLLTALALLMAAAGPAQAAVCARFTASDINVTYDPLGTEGVTQVVQPVSLTVSRPVSSVPGANPSSVTAQFVDTDSTTTLRIGTRGPIYAIEAAQPVLVDRIVTPLDPGHIFAHTFATAVSGGTEAIHGLQFLIDPGQDIPAGVYDESIDIQFRCNAGSSAIAGVDYQSAVLRVSVSVPSKLIANLAGGSTSGTIDFGDFSTLSKSALVSVYSTGPFSVSIASDNNGRMLLDGHPGTANGEIAYSVSFNNQPMTLGASAVFDRTGIGGASMPLDVVTEPVQGKRAGSYHDAVTVTLTPRTTL